MVAVNAGTLLSTVQNVQLPYLLKVLCTWSANLKTLIASATLKATVITSTEERCAWDSGLENANRGIMETMTPTQDGNLCPAFLWRRFPKLKLRFPRETDPPAY